MKNILITLLSLSVFSIAYSQCDNRVSTNPNNPSNDALPDIIGGSSPYTQDVANVRTTQTKRMDAQKTKFRYL